MNRKSPDPSPPASVTTPSEEHAALALREAAVLMAPVVQWLLRSGVSYGAFTDMLKTVFVRSAESELTRVGAQTTFSALSMLSGVHRKDVRAIQSQGELSAGATIRSVPLASQVYTRWLTSRHYRLRDGQPKTLPRSGPGATFETLAREISQDVHPRTVLDELLRLNLVRLEEEQVVPVMLSFSPSQRLDELTALFAANAADHLAAGVHNLTLGQSPSLEQSVFANGLSAESAAILHEKARALWAQAFEAMVAEATQRVEIDDAQPPSPTHRMRFGVYFHSEPQGQDSTGALVSESIQATSLPTEAPVPVTKSLPIRASRSRRAP